MATASREAWDERRTLCEAVVALAPCDVAGVMFLLRELSRGDPACTVETGAGRTSEVCGLRGARARGRPRGCATVVGERCRARSGVRSTSTSTWMRWTHAVSRPCRGVDGAVGRGFDAVREALCERLRSARRVSVAWHAASFSGAHRGSCVMLPSRRLRRTRRVRCAAARGWPAIAHRQCDASSTTVPPPSTRSAQSLARMCTVC